MGKKLNIDEEEIVELYKKYGSTNKVAEKINCSTFLVRQRLKNRGVNLKNVPNPIDKGTTDEIIALYNKKVPVKEISKKTGVAIPTIYKKLKQRNVEIKQRKIDAPIDQINEMRENGFNFKEIGAMFNCSGEWVRQKLIQKGEDTKIKTQFKTEQMLELHNEGESIGRIARILGCSKKTVRDRLKVELSNKNYNSVMTHCKIERKNEEVSKRINEFQPTNLNENEFCYEEFENKESLSSDELIKRLDEKYEGKPEFQEMIVKNITRPSALNTAIKEKHGYKCMICGYPGFEKKGGGRYAEVHHMIELNKSAPKTLQSWNLIVVCPICHKKLHYGNVETEFLDPGWKLNINGEKHYLK